MRCTPLKENDERAGERKICFRALRAPHERITVLPRPHTRSDHPEADFSGALKEMQAQHQQLAHLCRCLAAWTWQPEQRALHTRHYGCQEPSPVSRRLASGQNTSLAPSCAQPLGGAVFRLPFPKSGYSPATLMSLLTEITPCTERAICSARRFSAMLFAVPVKRT